MRRLPLSRGRKWVLVVGLVLALPTVVFFVLNERRKTAIGDLGAIGIPLVPRAPAVFDPLLRWLQVDPSHWPSLFWALDPNGEIEIYGDQEPVTAEKMAKMASSVDRLGGVRAIQVLQYETELDATALVHLRAITRLERLDLSACGLDDDDLRDVAKIESLRELNLDMNGNVSADGVRHLTDLPRLRKLSLVRTQVGVDAISALKALPALEEVRLGGDIDPRTVHEARKSVGGEMKDVTVWIYGRGDGVPEWDAAGDPL